MSWPTRPLAELCDLEIGKTPSRANLDYWRDGTLPWLSIADMNQGRHLRATKERVTDAGAKAARMKLVRPGTIVLSYKLSIGKVGFVQTAMFTNEAIAALANLDADVWPDYMYWALQHMDLLEGADRAAMGSTLNKAKLEQLRIPLPPLPEQRRIAAILDKADALRVKRRETIAKLDQLLQSVFLDMFGDPIANPKHFHAGCMGDYIAIGPSNGLSKTKEFLGRGVPLLDNKAVYRGMYVDFSDQRLIDVSDDEILRFNVQRGDIIFNRVSVKPEGVGVAALALDPPKNCVFESNLMRVRLSADLDPAFTITMLRTESCRRHVLENANIANQASISQGVIRSIPIVVPPPEKQKRFSACVNSLDKQRARLFAGQLSTSSLFSALQTRGFSGHL